MTALADVSGCPVFPSDNVWNAPVDTLPRHANSDAYVATIGATRGVHPDFGTVYQGAPIGIPFTTVPGSQPRVNVTFDYDDESDRGPYPIPADAPIEGGAQSDGDRHVLVIDRDNCVLYELFDAHPNANGTWRAGSGAIFPLRSNALRPSGWTSADAAGLPIFAGLVRYDEVAAGEIRHALRFTAPQTMRGFVWPARHFASSLTGVQYPPMGLRMRLKASFDVSGFSAPVQVILRALKRYGMILADNGSAWFISGAPDSRWNDDMLVDELARVKGSDFEAVDAGGLMADPNSGAVKASAPTVEWVTATEYYNAAAGRYLLTTHDTEAAGWTRTGATFLVAPAPRDGFSPVCRFHGNPQPGGNARGLRAESRLYTIDAVECDRARADSRWVDDGIAFYAGPTTHGTCPAPLRVLWLAYNNGLRSGEVNHRYSTDLSVLASMGTTGWRLAGPAMCVN